MEDTGIDKILEDAQNAFWKVISDAKFPLITTGDFPPEATLTFDEACESALLTWLYWNSPHQLMPAPDEAQLTCCPVCGEEYNVQDTESETYYDTINLVMDLYRHKKCGGIVRFTGGV